MTTTRKTQTRATFASVIEPSSRVFVFSIAARAAWI